MRRLVAAGLLVLACSVGCSSGEGEVSSAPGTGVDVTFEDGEVTPTGEKVEAHVGEPVVFVVTSDTDEELHVHGEPEAEFEVEAGMADHEFAYTPTVPGQIAVEAHHADVTVVTLVVTK